MVKVEPLIANMADEMADAVPVGKVPFNMPIHMRGLVVSKITTRAA